MAIKHFEQLYQRQWWLGFTIFVARKRVDATAENLGGFALVEIKLFPYRDDKRRIDDRRIHLLIEVTDQRHDTV